MRELDNLRGNDREIFAKQGEEIKEFRGVNETALMSYVKGLIMMSMNDLNYTNTDISFVLDEVTHNLLELEPTEVITFEWTHVCE